MYCVMCAGCIVCVCAGFIVWYGLDVVFLVHCVSMFCDVDYCVCVCVCVCVCMYVPVCACVCLYAYMCDTGCLHVTLSPFSPLSSLFVVSQCHVCPRWAGGLPGV